MDRLNFAKTRATLFALSLFLLTASIQNGKSLPNAGGAVNILSFGVAANDPHANARGAFQKAFAALAAQGGGTLHIPRGDYFVDFPDVANDVDFNDPGSSRAELSQKTLDRSKLLVVPPNTLIEGESEGGKLVSRIHWRATSFPIFNFINASRSGFVNLAFVFDGTQPRVYAWRTEQYLNVFGIHTKGEAYYELSAVAYSIGSDNLRFENLSFASGAAHPDNEHTFAFGIVVKGKDPIVEPPGGAGRDVPAGGLRSCASNNTFRALRFADFVMGIVADGQCNAVFEDISANHRGSWFRSLDPTHEKHGGRPDIVGPPGHLIYITGQDVYSRERDAQHPEGHFIIQDIVRNKNLTIRNIKEGPDTYSDFNSLGTLALKYIDGGTVENVDSHHPSGLIVSMADAHHLSLQNLSWSSDRDMCEDETNRANCHHPVIQLVPQWGSGSTGFNDDVTFKNISLRSTRWTAVFEIVSPPPPARQSNHITVDGLTLESPSSFQAGQGSPQGMITVLGSDIHFTNVKYIPHVLPSAVPEKINTAAQIRPGSKNTTIDIETHAPADHPELNSRIMRAIVEEHQPGQEAVGLNNGSVITSHQAR